MKKLITLPLAIILAGCGAIVPVQPTATSAPPPTPQVVIATVLVTVVPTQAPTEVPTATTAPTQTPNVIVVTATSQPGAAAAAPTSGQQIPITGGGTATATLPADAFGSLFPSMSRSGSYFNLRCIPQDITFNVTTNNFAVIEVDLYYRMEDLTTQPITLSDWHNLGKMTSDKNGNFTMDVNTSMLSPDLRASAKAWFDYQFVGISKTGDAVGRSGKISQQVLYLKDCP